jgi:hypothetical protein
MISQRTAVSICLYPLRSAHSTALPTSFGFDCHVPRPIAGILSPVLSVNVFLWRYLRELESRAWEENGEGGWLATILSLRRLLQWENVNLVRGLMGSVG